MTFLDSWDIPYDFLGFVEHSIKRLRTCGKSSSTDSDSFYVYSSFDPIKKILEIYVNPYQVESNVSYIYGDVMKIVNKCLLDVFFQEEEENLYSHL